MPFNGSGTYTLPAGNPVVSGSVISSATHIATNSDIATALTACITKDGQSTITANIPFSVHKITGLAAGTTAGDSVRYEQVMLLSGVNTMSANMAMGNNKITGLAAGTVAGDSVRYEQAAKIDESTGANSDIKSLTGLTTPLSPAQGGTGGTLPVANGGTGANTLTVNSVLLGNGTAAVSALSSGSFGQVLLSNGAGVAPSFGDFPASVGAPAFLLINSGII